MFLFGRLIVLEIVSGVLNFVNDCLVDIRDEFILVVFVFPEVLNSVRLRIFLNLPVLLDRLRDLIFFLQLEFCEFTLALGHFREPA